VEVTAGTIAGVLAEKVELEQSAATVVVTRQLEMEQAAGALVVAESVHMRDSAVGFLLAREVRGAGIRVLFGPSGALALGAGLAAALWLLRRLGR
jgi:hypothetical protein